MVSISSSKSSSPAPRRQNWHTGNLPHEPRAGPCARETPRDWTRASGGEKLTELFVTREISPGVLQQRYKNSRVACASSTVTLSLAERLCYATAVREWAVYNSRHDETHRGCSCGAVQVTVLKSERRVRASLATRREHSKHFHAPRCKLFHTPQIKTLRWPPPATRAASSNTRLRLCMILLPPAGWIVYC